MAQPSWIWKETAEVIGVLGIIAGIVFLGYEMRQNTMAVRSEASLGLQNQISSIYEMLLDDPMMDIFLSGMADPSSLSPSELAKFHSFWTVGLQAYENMYVQVREGAYEAQRADGWWQLPRDNFESPGMQAHWQLRANLLSTEFREFIKTEIMTRAATSGYNPLGVPAE